MPRPFHTISPAWRLTRWLAPVLLAAAGCACTSEAATSRQVGGGEGPSRVQPPFALESTAPRAEIGGLISIPGNPLPPVPKESIENAIPIYERLLAILGLFGDPASQARGKGYLATLYAAVGHYAKAEHLFDEALALLQRNAAANLDLGWVHNNRGLVRLARHRYTEAAGSFRSAVDALASDRPELREPCAIAWQNLASAYHVLGDLEAAESAYLEALSILRRLGGERDRAYQTTSQNLAELYGSIGDAEATRKILVELLAKGEIRDPTLHFAILNNLGVALRHLREFPAAEARLREALTLAAPGSSDQALASMNLGATHFDAGDFAAARQEERAALRTLEAANLGRSPWAAAVKASLGTLEFFHGDLAAAETWLTQAKKTLATATEGQQRALAEIDEELALVAQRRGQRDLARDLGRQALDLETRNLDQILAFGSEAQRLAYQSNAFPYDHLANLGEPTLLAEAVLRLKGAVLESLLRERALARRSTRPVDREWLDRIHGLKVEVMEETARGASPGSTRRSALELALQQEETALAKSLHLGLGSVPRANLAGVRVALASDQALVELIRFQLYTSGGKLVPHYGAIVIADQGQPTWIDLGKAETLELLIEGLLHQMERGGRGTVSLLPTAGDGNLAADLRRLYDLLWKPLLPAFPAGARRVLLSPDGALHFVPWAALLDDHDELLAAHWRIAQVNSGRDLLRPTSATTNRTLLALADARGDLPYAQSEVASIEDMARAGGWQTTVLLGRDASEPALFQRRSPRILHLATHGGEIDRELSQTIGQRLSRQPMYRGYLLLGGAAESLAAWKQGSVLPLSQDGLLTAEEVGGLDLSGTWLTVLSACRSGAGEARSGEGILGLRRGFALAGTEYLLFTLWSVDDEATAVFMKRFYEQIFQQREPSFAFLEVQAAELERLRRQEGLAAAVYRAGGLVLTR